MSSPSELPEGVHVQLRLLISHAPEQRFNSYGAEILQFHGKVVDAVVSHPPVVVRFSGQRKAELYRWAAIGKHLSVEGLLEVKTWRGKDGQPRVALLVEALNVFPLGEAEPDPSRLGVYALPTRRGGEDLARATPLSRAQRAERMRRALEEA